MWGGALVGNPRWDYASKTAWFAIWDVNFDRKWTFQHKVKRWVHGENILRVGSPIEKLNSTRGC